MINKVKITNLHDAESYSYNKNNTDYNVWVSVVGSEDKKQITRMKKNFREKNVKFFSQFFADWSDEDGIAWKHLENEAPQLQHIQNIITFLKPFAEDEKSHTLGVNCFAGISRSTAIGITALVMSGRTVEQALEEIVKDRAIAWPNLRILGFASDILNIDIHGYVSDWKKKCMNSDEIFIMPDRLQKTI
jgi:predicted protein tyrosine phosphatase